MYRKYMYNATASQRNKLSRSHRVDADSDTSSVTSAVVVYELSSCTEDKTVDTGTPASASDELDTSATIEAGFRKNMGATASISLPVLTKGPQSIPEPAAGKSAQQRVFRGFISLPMTLDSTMI